ncbi:MAG: amidase [Pseudomonadota bacterium]
MVDAYLSATDALRAFRDGTLSPVDLTRALIARAEATETLNAFSFTHFDAALSQARAAEARWRAGTARALEGFCVAIKDSGNVAGQPTSMGSLTASDAPQTSTSPVNDHVLAAGAICHARTATPEFSCAAVTHSRRWGVTRNPWDPALTPGGSSGGAGVALATGAATLATGSDIGGSIRIPASCCGVVGYKPPRGRNPVDPPFNLDPYCHTGPLARSVSDAALLQDVMCGPHPGDPQALAPAHRLSLAGGIQGWRIGYSLDLNLGPIDDIVRHRTLAALDVFRDLGATVSEIALPWQGVTEAALDHLRTIFAGSLAVELRDQPDRLTPYARRFAQEGAALPLHRYYDALDTAARAASDFGQAIDGFDLFLCPTTAVPAIAADHDQSRDTLRIGGAVVDPMLGWVLTHPFNMLSSHPVLSVPTGHAPCPTGLQIVGRPWRDDDVFCAGLAYETALGGWFAPDARPPDPS